MAILFGLLAFILAVVLGLMVAFYFQARMETEKAKQETMRVEQQAKTDLSRYQGIADLEKFKADLEGKIRTYRAALPKFETMAEMEAHRVQLAQSAEQYSEASKEWQQHVAAQEATLSDLVARAEAVEETLDMQSFGFYRPKYDFEDSERYAYQLANIRDEQKTMVKSDRATHCPQSWTVDGSATKGRKMVKEHAKLMLRAFNGECDAAIAKVKFDNANNLESRLKRTFEAINKLGESKQLWITSEYFNLKLQELYLVHEHREKKQEEREEQRRIKDEMREEQRVLKEIEKAKNDAEKEEINKATALEHARQQLMLANDNQTERLRLIVDRLEAELKEALERKAKAIARAQLTRSGHVYVLSNIGSFGEGVYKIGMTRRLEPLERVKELGDASVPFQFDVHAMIYSEDAPALENALHQRFAARRLNLANLRREYFHVTLDEVRVAVGELFGEITFVKTPHAHEYRETLAIRAENSVRTNGTPDRRQPQTV